MTSAGPQNISPGDGFPAGGGSGPVFLAAQQAAGVVAAKHRGDFAGAEELLSVMGDERAQARGFCLLAELALTLVRSQTGQSMDDLVQELSLLMADAAFTAQSCQDDDGCAET